MSSHNYRHLVARWKSLARRAGLRLRPLATADGFPLFYIETRAAAHAEPAYLSAGVHGDESGATEGLLAWAESESARLRDLPLLIFPCLNPWGLCANVRVDAQGFDLNRSFHLAHPVVDAVRTVVGTRRLRISVHLHEDYDGEGVYLYELARRAPWGEAIIEAARPWIGPDMRTKIDISRARAGIVRRRVNRQTFAKMGYPEAIWLYFEHTDHSLTIETPSEFALERRIGAHVAALDAIARRVFL